MPDASGQVRCDTCGAHGPASSRYCTTCGTARQAPPAVPQPPVAGVSLTKEHDGGVSLAKSPEPPTVITPSPSYGAIPPAVPPVMPFAPVAAPYTPSTPPYVQPRPPARRGRRALVALAVAFVLVGAGVAGVVVLAGDDGDEPSAQASDAPPADPVGSAVDSAVPDPETVTVTVDPEPTEEATSEVSTAPVPEPVEVPARCWDGASAPSIDDCTAPQGAAGLRYVFAGFDFTGEGCDTTGIRRSNTRRFHYQCENEGSVYFNFSEFDSQRAGESYYNTNAGTAGTSVRGDLLQWTSYTGTDYKGAVMYAGGRWGATVYATDPATRDRTLANLVRRMVPADRLRGRPLS